MLGCTQPDLESPVARPILLSSWPNLLSVTRVKIPVSQVLQALTHNRTDNRGLAHTHPRNGRKCPRDLPEVDQSTSWRSASRARGRLVLASQQSVKAGIQKPRAYDNGCRLERQGLKKGLNDNGHEWGRQCPWRTVHTIATVPYSSYALCLQYLLLLAMGAAPLSTFVKAVVAPRLCRFPQCQEFISSLSTIAGWK